MEPADLLWRDGVPESARFGDVYFSRDNGLEETRYVFLARNNLRERFSALGNRAHFVIAETGFGTGLNFLAAWAEWLACRPEEDHAILHFVSVERFPLTRADLEKALSFWPELDAQARELIAAYPPLIQGTHRLVLAGGRVRLTLYFGDVLDAWQDLIFSADAWFLDGFAPSLNPEMWLEQAITQIRRHSKPGTTLATFTAVGRIRRALADAGFTMSKVPGFGRKREMLSGFLEPDEETAALPGQRTVGIIGAGIAGATLARTLAERGVPVLLIDRASQPGSGASGNPQGALYVKLGVEFNAQTELATTALTFGQRYYRRWSGDFWHPTGLLQLAPNAHEASRQQRFAERNQYPVELLEPVDAEEGSRRAGLRVETPGLWFPGSGWLEPARACATLARHSLIETAFDFPVQDVSRHGSGWRVTRSDGAARTVDQLVIASGEASGLLAPVDGALRLKPIRGQVTCLPADDLPLPEAVICGSKYLNPAHRGQAVTGATFDLKDDNTEVTVASHQENLDELQKLLPAVFPDGPPAAGTLTGRVSFRCTTHDYQPVAGELVDTNGQAVSGLFLLTGYGSKGLTWAPILAEYLADCLTGQPLCLPRRLIRRVETSRLYRKPA